MYFKTSLCISQVYAIFIFKTKFYWKKYEKSQKILGKKKRTLMSGQEWEAEGSLESQTMEWLQRIQKCKLVSYLK